jgi:phage head maturation protease
MSFAFRVRPNGENWVGQRRELRSLDLAEISVVQAWPAYPDTVVDIRGMSGAQFPHLRRALARWRP